MIVAQTSIILTTLFSLTTPKAIGKLEPPLYLSRNDIVLGEKLGKAQRTPSMPVSARLFEGDIAGIEDPNSYMEQLHAAMTQNMSNGHANAIKSPLSKWPNAIIPYTINENVNAEGAREAIADAIKEIQVKTCVKIVPRTNENHYVSIESGDDGCYSFVGRLLKGTKQILNLGICDWNVSASGDACETHHTVVHELMHAIGFFHEHSRSDRDKYLTIITSNIKDGQLRQFDTKRLDEATDLNTTFDYDSVMLYRTTHFSKNGQPTMLPKQRGKEIGYAPGLSSNDVLKINLLYDCATNGAQSGKGYEAGQCADSNVLCPTWKADMQCERNSAWMNKNCKKTCGQCKTRTVKWITAG